MVLQPRRAQHATGKNLDDFPRRQRYAAPNSSTNLMKNSKPIAVAILTAAFVAAPFVAFAADTTAPADKAPAATAAKAAKAYPLKTCIVSDEKLGGDMGEPYVFTYKGQEIKMCCKDCRKDFDKNPTKYIKKLEAAAKKSNKTDSK